MRRRTSLPFTLMAWCSDSTTQRSHPPTSCLAMRSCFTSLCAAGIAGACGRPVPLLRRKTLKYCLVSCLMCLTSEIWAVASVDTFKKICRDTFTETGIWLSGERCIFLNLWLVHVCSMKSISNSGNFVTTAKSRTFFFFTTTHEQNEWQSLQWLCYSTPLL